MASRATTWRLGTATIPSGMTVTGAGLFDSQITVDNGDYQFLVELPGRAPVLLTASNVNFAPHLAAFDDDPTCAGTYNVPTAPTGKVCIYIGGYAGLDSASGYAADALQDRYFDILFQANGSAGGDIYMYYSWAYTAP